MKIETLKVLEVDSREELNKVDLNTIAKAEIVIVDGIIHKSRYGKMTDLKRITKSILGKLLEDEDGMDDS